MRAALIILSALLLIGCSTERRCARAVNRCAALWKHDTTFIHDSITIERNTIDTVLRWNFLTLHDTVTIRDGRAVIRIVRLPGDSIWVQGECRDTVIRYGGSSRWHGRQGWHILPSVCCSLNRAVKIYSPEYQAVRKIMHIFCRE